MRAESAAEWHRLWETDIVVEAAPEFQRLIHSMLFYLLSSARGGVEYSIPPMGLSTAGYYGHIFWDADTYMFPTLMVLHPEMARPIVMFRYQTLEAAEANARLNGWKGAV
jgi:trehalose/maltose hydrolase-like predicted phosphorylase